MPPGQPDPAADRLPQLLVEVDALRAKCEAADSAQEQLKQLLGGLQQERADLEAELLFLRGLSQEHSLLRQELEQVRSGHGQLEAELAEWKQLHAELQGQLVAKCAELATQQHAEQQACKEWEDKYADLHDRHVVAKSEFDRLKQLSSERKRALASMSEEVCKPGRWVGGLL